jgi:DNA-binding CsgD family transcriptional regulator
MRKMAVPAITHLRLLTEKDMGEVLEIIRLAHCDLRLSGMRTKVVKALRNAFRARGVAFFVADRNYERIDNGNMVSLGMDLNYLDSWLRRFCHDDPFQRESRTENPVCKVDDILSYKQWERLKLYNEFYRPQNIYYKLSMHLESKGRVLGLIGMCRPKAERDFTEREVAKAHVLTPHLVTALENISILPRWEQEQAQLASYDDLWREQYGLTKREIDIVRCVCEGMTNEQIADRLCISRFTVETHLKNIFDKTGVKHRAAFAGLLLLPQARARTPTGSSP